MKILFTCPINYLGHNLVARVVNGWTSEKEETKEYAGDHLLSVWDPSAISHDWWVLWGTGGTISDSGSGDLCNSTRQHSR